MGDAAAAAFPASLQWVERGSALIRRMNSERIAEDPRLRRLLQLPAPSPPPPSPPSAAAPACPVIDEHASLFGESDLEEEEKPPAPRSVVALTPRESFEEIEAASADGGATKQESENAASNTYRVLLWTYRLQASVQSSLAYALTAKTSEDGYFIPICPRVYCIAPMYVNTFNRLFDAHTSTRQWNAAKRLLEQLDALVSKKFDTGACIFDCGLFDGVKRLHHKPLVYDEFCVAAWLDLKESHVAVLVAPNNDQMSVFATCCSLYCTETSTFPETFANELLDVYQQHIRGSESWLPKLQRTFSGAEAKNTNYMGGGVPRPQARFVADFCKLLVTRDRRLQLCAASPAMDERKQKLTGVAVAPAPQQIYIHQIVLGATDDDDVGAGDDNTKPESALLAPDTSRPYFVIQSEKGVLFSSLVNGVRNTNLASGVHAFQVAKTFLQCGDLVLKMYHLPYGRQGELLFECRLHTSLLLDLIETVTSGGGGDDEDDDALEQGEVTLRLASGDFDCVSSNHPFPKQFAVRLRFARNESAFPPERSARAKPVRYEGPSVVSFLLSEPNVRTAFGDVVLEKIDVIRRVNRSQLDIFLLFYVNVGFGDLKVLPLRHLFRYVLPEAVRARMVEMGASEEALRETAPSQFDFGIGMTFDEEYARWLQHLYDSDFGVPIVEVQPSDDYRAVRMTIYVAQEASPQPFIGGRRPPMRARGAPMSLINQLPTYIFSTSKEKANQATPDCLVCRCGFSVGEEIKSLPCFHSYHSECIDSWLCLNKVCPVCQFSIDHAHPSS
ncbi:hypothetical protein PybrP1_004563 [[Pythium] brassicae (nom. inval.)]|nr:hypothetical protein PybrP1_004563 [[Pythium] brassicae (nom. inval.)]